MTDAEKTMCLQASILNLGRLLAVGMTVQFFREPGDPRPRVRLEYPDGLVQEFAFTAHHPIYMVPPLQIDAPTMVRVSGVH